MSERYARLYGDGSFDVFSDTKDLETARRMLSCSSDDNDTQLVLVDIKVRQIFGPKAIECKTEPFIKCPCCGEEIEVSHD